LTAEEIVDQFLYVVYSRSESFEEAKEHKINYTRMGEPFLNLENVKQAIEMIDSAYPGTHHYVSTIGIARSDFSWIKENTTLQISLHSLDEEKRNWLIPYNDKMSISELGQVRTNSRRKTTLNMTLVDESDFSIKKLKEYFDKEKFFIKLSPINTNNISDKNNLGKGCIKYINER
jgi:23S rRNA (adenine2503-C2)-methyltransferase